ncbi:hypothetical protein [Lysobacter solisilvae (ex Woo and Kim 2020)]|uniref:Uncharacterized protein n=1 Tax=Agrilutibacter terrestris TaxID=2865112 RepID=A0A7H0FVL2_9GAMM|nr:hypothetical protein [Lysobacter terrestris]QNP40078.1 hypothetical protein H8B22_11310 [Lysobacter terrestris]
MNNEHSSSIEAAAPAAAPAAEPGLAPTTPAPRDAAAIAPQPGGPVVEPVVIRAWRRLRDEPGLFFTTAYLFVSFIGLWASFWFYRGFGLPILEYLQASDYLVAGLRDPAYVLILLGSILLTLVISGPDLYRRRHPQRVAELRTRWWARIVFPENRWLRWKGVGVTPETGVAFAVFWGMMWATVYYVDNRGEYIRDGRTGHVVQVTMAGAAAPVPQAARLLGSSSTYVFLWWPQDRVAEAVPIESIATLRSLPRPVAATTAVRPKSGASAAKP